MKRYLIVAENNKGRRWFIARGRKLVWRIELLKEEETFQTREEAEEEARKLDEANRQLTLITDEQYRRIRYQKILEIEIL